MSRYPQIAQRPGIPRRGILGSPSKEDGTYIVRSGIGQPDYLMVWGGMGTANAGAGAGAGAGGGGRAGTAAFCAMAS
jgi:hypothetical protein